MSPIKILVPVFFLLVSNAFAAEWTMFHGPNGNNRSSETGLLTSWPEGGPKLLWKIRDIGEKTSGYSTVTIQNGRLFTTGMRGGRSFVFCFDLEGNKLWDYDNGPAWTKSYPGTRSTPTLDGDYLYDFSAMGELVCLTASEGKRVWSRNMLTDFEGENIIWALSESIRIDGDRLYCAPGGKQASFVALNKRTGETIWTTPSLGEKTSYACPIIVEQEGLRMILTTYAKGMFGVNAENGELLFVFRHEQRYDINSTRLIYHDGHLLLVNTVDQGGEGAVKLKLTVRPTQTAGSALSQASGTEISNRLQYSSGKVSLEEVWRNKNFDNLHDSVMLIDGFLYGGSFGYRAGVFMCVEWNTGETRYTGRNIGKGASFTWAEGLLYLLTDKGEMLLIRPNPERFEVISQFDLPEEGEGPTWAHPVVCGKRLYLRHGAFLYCYDIAKGEI